MSKQVLVTGASSLLMQQVCKNLIQHGFECTGISRAEKNIDTTIYKNWLTHDLNQDISKLDLIDFSYIIHAAACTHSFTKKDYFESNVHITKKLVLQAKKSGVQQFIFISSRAAVQDGGWYAESKLAAEKIVLEHYPNAIIIRPSEIYGGTKQEGIDALIEKIKSNKFIFYPANIQEKMYPIFIEDATQLIAEKIMDNHSGVYTINGPEGFSFLEFITTVSRILNKRITTIPIPLFVLQFVCFIQQYLKLKIGIYPDQLKRLMAVKENVNPSGSTRKITEFIK